MISIAVEAALACCAACFVGILENMVEYFNRYAYIEIGKFQLVQLFLPS